LEREVAHGEDLIDQQHLGLEMGGDRERQAHLHPARVALNRGVQERPDVGKLDDLVELGLDLAPAHVEDRSVEEDVLAAGQVGVKAGPDLEQRADAAAQPGAALSRRRDPGEDLEQRALAGAVVADHAERLSALDLEADVAQSPELARLRLAPSRSDALADLLR